MSADAISASEAARRNLDAVRRSYNSSLPGGKSSNSAEKNSASAKAFDGTSMPFDLTGLLNSSGLLNAFTKVASLTGSNNAAVNNNSPSANTIATSTITKKDLGSSELLGFQKSKGFSNRDASFMPSLFGAEDTKEVSDIKVNHMTGQSFISTLTEIMEEFISVFSNYNKQIAYMSKLPTTFAMDLWKLFSSISVAVVESQQEKLNKQIQDARDAAESAGKCGALGGIGEVLMGAALVAVSIAAMPFTAGFSAATVCAGITATVGLISGAVAAGDGVMKAKAGFELWQNAQSYPDIQGLLNSCLPQLQFGFYSLAGSGAANFEMWFTIATTALSIGASTGEILAGKTVEKAAAEGVEEAVGTAVAKAAPESTFLKILKNVPSMLAKKSKPYAYLNSIVSIVGLIGSAADPSDKATAHDGHADDKGQQHHTIGLWQSLSSGIAGALVYLIFETAPPGQQTLGEQLSSKNQYALLVVESITMFALCMGTACMEAAARSDLKMDPKFSQFLLRQTIMQITQMFLQIEVQAGQITVETLMAFKNAAAMSLQAEYAKLGSEFQLFQTYIESLAEKNSKEGSTEVSTLIKNSTQAYGAFMTAIKDALNSYGQPIRNNYM